MENCKLPKNKIAEKMKPQMQKSTSFLHPAILIETVKVIFS